MNIDELDWKKGNDLLPAVIQDAENGRVLMLGYMNKEALAKTLETKLVTFFGRSKQALWVKGETSGHFLDFVSVEIDCDKDTLLIQARPRGPTCHLQTQTCFNDKQADPVLFLNTLSSLIKTRNAERPKGSYTTKLFEEGKQRIAQKIGEEGVELALACVANDRKNILDESSDLLFHMLVLLEESGLSLAEVCAVLQERHKPAGV